MTAFFFLPSYAQAQSYEAGTVGYLYEDCKSALVKSQDFKAFHETYCGAFSEGYAVGVMATGAMKFQAPPKTDSCAADRARVYDHINARFCKNLPAFNETTTDPAYIFNTVIGVVERWIDFSRQHAGKDDPLTERVIGGAINDMLRPGAFCDSLSRYEDRPLPEINKTLLSGGAASFLAFQKALLTENKNAQCQQDLKNSGRDAQAFERTRCGAEITGFITGVQWMARLQQSKPAVAETCARETDRLYKLLDAEQSMCVSAKTEPMQVAEIYTKNYAMLKSAQGGGGWMSYFTPGSVNSAGYDVIYRGFLCLNNGR